MKSVYIKLMIFFLQFIFVIFILDSYYQLTVYTGLIEISIFALITLFGSQIKCKVCSTNIFDRRVMGEFIPIFLSRYDKCSVCNSERPWIFSWSK